MGLESEDSTRRNRNRSWWQRRTHLERNIIVLLAVAIIIIGALIVAMLIMKYGNQSNNNICNTPGCVQASAKILNNMDESVNPCDDFYQFACGKFLREAVIPEDRTEVGSFYNLNDLVQGQLRTIFEEPAAPNELTPFVQLKQLYSVCLNTTAIEEGGLAVARELIRDLGGWPILEGSSWDERSFDWKKSSYKFREHGLSTDNFIKVEVTPDFINASRLTIQLDQAELEIARDNLLGGFDDEVVNGYYVYMVNLAQLFGVQRVFAEYEVKQMIEFKIQLANISNSDEERREKTKLYHPMTVQELQQTYPDVYWSEFLNNVVGFSNQPVSSDQLVNVAAPNYLSKVAYLLSRTSKRAQANHAIFQALRSSIACLPQKARHLEQQYLATLFGTTKGAPRWTDCVTLTSKTFDIASAALYVRKYAQDETKRSAMEMISDIQQAFVKLVKNADWMDESTKKKAVEKALALRKNVAYPDEFKDDKELEEYYSELSVNDDTLLRFVSNANLFKANKEKRLLEQSLNKTDWKTRYTQIEVNAVYNPQENSIQLPIVVLQDIVFDKDRLRSMNYGNMGFFVGHEITHGFDDEGRKFDQEGDMINWWDNKTSEAFIKKTECIIQQYSDYIVSEIGQNIDGVLTQGENIADNGGVKEAYLAYMNWVERNGPEPALPGLKYSAKQLFWISAANTWCAKERPESMQNSILDVHSPMRFRIIGAFSNSKYFASDFQCPVGSKMNPKRKCEIW